MLEKSYDEALPIALEELRTAAQQLAASIEHIADSIGSGALAARIEASFKKRVGSGMNRRLPF